jgi:hypothetical protein
MGYIKGNWITQKQLVANAIYTMWTTIFLTAIIRQTKCLFIGPIGCGAFAPKNNQEAYKTLMAQILAKVIQQYKHYFHAIIFVDYDPKNQYRNLGIFERVFKEAGFILGELGDIISITQSEPQYITDCAKQGVYKHVPISPYVMEWDDMWSKEVVESGNKVGRSIRRGPKDLQRSADTASSHVPDIIEGRIGKVSARPHDVVTIGDRTQEVSARQHVSDTVMPLQSNSMVGPVSVNDMQSKSSSGSGPVSVNDMQSKPGDVRSMKPVGQGFVQSGLLWYGTALVSSIIGYTLR